MKVLYNDGTIAECAPEEELHIIRHSAAHIMAQAIKRLYPEADFGYGPATENGFYYDIDLPEGVKISEDDFPAIEAEMRKIAKENLKVETYELPRDEAIAHMAERGEKYKVEHIGDLPEDARITFYKQGEYVDMCVGPHITYTKALKAFKLTGVSGAYWKNDANNKMLTRINGIAFPSKEELDAHLAFIEEAKKRDHRKIGQEMELFMFADEGPGFPFWLPNGMRLRNALMDYWHEMQEKYDYDEVLSLLQPEMAADLSLVTLENLVIPGAKVSELVVPAEVMRMLALGGVNTAALGFGRAWEQAAAGIAATRSAAQAEGLRVIGAYAEETEAGVASAIFEVGGVRVALLHCTQTISSRSKTNLKKDGKPALLPLTDSAPEYIAEARRLGAQAVIVSVHWGSEGKTAPTAAQRKIAEAMAEAGADVILGSGARRVQPAEWLPGPAGRNTLCLWCLGCLLSDARGDGAVAGMLARMTFSLDSAGRLHIAEPVYIPTYQWRFSLDGAAGYRVISALGDAPDGMDSTQQKARAKARERVEKIMRDGPLAEAAE